MFEVFGFLSVLCVCVCAVKCLDMYLSSSKVPHYELPSGLTAELVKDVEELKSQVAKIQLRDGFKLK